LLARRQGDARLHPDASDPGFLTAELGIQRAPGFGNLPRAQTLILHHVGVVLRAQEGLRLAWRPRCVLAPETPSHYSLRCHVLLSHTRRHLCVSHQAQDPEPKQEAEPDLERQRCSGPARSM
jgi:hypothetical protein